MEADQEELSQEDMRQQQIAMQNKEKKIKIIRILTVIAYLMSVSTAATMLSTYYIFIWNPHAGNVTQTPNAERIVMAFQRTSGEYDFANNAVHEYTGNGKLTSEALIDHTVNDHTSSPDGFIRFQTATIKSSTSHKQTTTVDDFAEPFAVTDNTS